MKIVLKRRKHRNGVRPARKGSLKINLQALPTAYEQLQNIMALMKYREKHAPLVGAWDLVKAGKLAEFERIMRASKALNRLHDFMFKGHDHLKEYKPIKPMNLALKAINEVNPLFVGKRESACNTCEHKNSCPYEGHPRCSLDVICPIRRRAHIDRVLKAVNDEPTDTPLTQSDMANLAVKHLS